MGQIKAFFKLFYFTVPQKVTDDDYVMRLGDEERHISRRTAVMIRKYSMLFMLAGFIVLGSLPVENANFPLEIVCTVGAAAAFCLFIRYLAKH